MRWSRRSLARSLSISREAVLSPNATLVFAFCLRASYDYMSHPHHDSFDELATLAEQHDGKP